MKTDRKKSSKKFLWLVLIVLLILLGFSLFGFPLKVFFISLLEKSGGNAPAVPPIGQINRKIDPHLVGNWDTGCLVPKGNSDYAERHTFTFNSDGMANHKRYIGGRLCNNLELRDDQPMTWEIVGPQKINIYYATGGKIYDIYEISAGTLKMGHGFCDCLSYAGKTGSSDEDRFVILNNFLVYKKK